MVGEDPPNLKGGGGNACKVQNNVNITVKDGIPIVDDLFSILHRKGCLCKTDSVGGCSTPAAEVLGSPRL